MYLQNLTLKNFRCFESIDIPFHKNLSVIVGTNGAGKTTILEGAAIALGTLLIQDSLIVLLYLCWINLRPESKIQI